MAAADLDPLDAARGELRAVGWQPDAAASRMRWVRQFARAEEGGR